MPFSIQFTDRRYLLLLKIRDTVSFLWYGPDLPRKSSQHLFQNIPVLGGKEDAVISAFFHPLLYLWQCRFHGNRRRGSTHTGSDIIRSPQKNSEPAVFSQHTVSVLLHFRKEPWVQWRSIKIVAGTVTKHLGKQKPIVIGDIHGIGRRCILRRHTDAEIFLDNVIRIPRTARAKRNLNAVSLQKCHSSRMDRQDAADALTLRHKDLGIFYLIHRKAGQPLQHKNMMK